MNRKTYRRVRFWAPVLAALGIVVVVFQNYGRPYIAELQHGDQFKQLAFDCDMAMHEEAALRDLRAAIPRLNGLN